MAQSILPTIVRKRDGGELSTPEIENAIAGVTSGQVPDYQIAALLMAIYLQGMTDRETADLTRAMVHSGEVLDLSAIPGFKADKHSTGGVGDKVTLVLGPLVAAAGVYFPKLSGRGLGHTGGTLDKLESIPGFSVDLTIERFIRQVNAIGLAVAGQTAELAPADGILYALRDVTATVDSIPLIASSVMSKKIAAGADGIVLDVKVGRGAFMPSVEDAVALARLMVTIGESAGKRTIAIITSMDEPLGYAIGNALEVREAISTLRDEPPGKGLGHSSPELRQVCLLLGAHILLLAGHSHSLADGQAMLAGRLAEGAALAKLREMIAWQGGEPRVIDDQALLPQAQDIVAVPSPQEGFVQRIDARQVAEVAMRLGAGREVKGQAVDHAVGVVLWVGVGDLVKPGETLAEIHTNHRIPNGEAIADLLAAFGFGTESPVRTPHVLDTVGAPPAAAFTPR